MKTYLSPAAYEIFKCQLDNYHKLPKGRRFTDQMKMVSLGINAQSTKTYEFLSDIFILTTKTTLDKTTSGLKVPPGPNPNIMKALKKKVESMPDRSKDVQLCLDEMHLKTSLSYRRDKDVIEGFADYGGIEEPPKEYANQALVWCVRGLHHKLKQPLGYLFSSDATPPSVMKKLIDECLTELFAMGLRVQFLITDQWSSNRKLVTKYLGVRIDKPFYMFNEHKIFVAYDPPHLLKSVRNNLLNKDYVMPDGNLIMWDHVRDMVELETAKPLKLRLAPKLARSTHVAPSSFKRMKVKYAAQVFSNTTAAALSTYATAVNSPIASNAVHTARFLKKMDNLFDCFQSVAKFSEKPYKGAITETSPHVEYLQEMDKLFKVLKTQKRRTVEVDDLADDEQPQNTEKNTKKKRKPTQPPCFAGWRLTIHAILQFWEEAKKSGETELKTRNMNQDCLGNLFGVVRRLGGNSDNPTCVLFRQFFKQIIISDILNLRHSGGANCELDTAKILFDFDSLQSLRNDDDDDGDENNNDADLDCTGVVVPVFNNLNEDSVEANKIFYIAGVCAKKFVDLHSPCGCHQYVVKD